MDSLTKVDDADQYINPYDPSVQAIILQLRSEGVITDKMSNDQIATALYNYVENNYSYIPNKQGTNIWNTVAQTIQAGGGDCNDLSNLLASLMEAAFIDKGMTLSEAASRVKCDVVVTAGSNVGHVYVSYIDDSGTARKLDATEGKDVASITDLPLDLSQGMTTELFTYNSLSVNVLDAAFDYTDFMTACDEALINVPQTDTVETVLYTPAAMDAENNIEVAKEGLTLQIDTLEGELESMDTSHVYTSAGTTFVNDVSSFESYLKGLQIPDDAAGIDALSSKINSWTQKLSSDYSAMITANRNYWAYIPSGTWFNDGGGDFCVLGSSLSSYDLVYGILNGTITRPSGTMFWSVDNTMIDAGFGNVGNIYDSLKNFYAYMDQWVQPDINNGNLLNKMSSTESNVLTALSNYKTAVVNGASALAGLPTVQMTTQQFIFEKMSFEESRLNTMLKQLREILSATSLLNAQTYAAYGDSNWSGGVTNEGNAWYNYAVDKRYDISPLGLSGKDKTAQDAINENPGWASGIPLIGWGWTSGRY